MGYFEPMDPVLTHALYRVTAKARVDLHGKTVPEAEKIIDQLAAKGGMWEIITGHGTGALKNLVKRLQSVYDFKILSVAPNGAAFVVDFS